MCELCWQTPCHPRCPNAPEPQTVFYCDGCGEAICEGDDYWELGENRYCESCVDDSRKTAEIPEEDRDYD